MTYEVNEDKSLVTVTNESGSSQYFVKIHTCPHHNCGEVIWTCNCPSFLMGIPRQGLDPLHHPCKHIRFLQEQVKISINPEIEKPSIKDVFYILKFVKDLERDTVNTSSIGPVVIPRPFVKISVGDMLIRIADKAECKVDKITRHEVRVCSSLNPDSVTRADLLTDDYLVLVSLKLQGSLYYASEPGPKFLVRYTPAPPVMFSHEINSAVE